MSIGFRLKQYIKSYIQNKYLPSVYKKAVRKNKVDKDLIIMADMHSNGIPYSMKAVYKELVNRGKQPVVYCRDIKDMSMLESLKFMTNFMKDYSAAGYVYICSYFLPVSSCEKRTETKVIQLWHSGGLMKKMGYDTKDDIPKDYKGNVTANYDLVTVSAPVCVPIWQQALGLPEGITKSLGLARTDILFNKKWQQKCKDTFYELYPDAKGKKIVLYAPTFSGNAAYPKCPGLDMGLEEKFKELKDYYLIIRPHPHMKRQYPQYFDERAKKLPTERLLPVADIMLTDYSSTLFDYSIYQKPFILFCPDLDEYIEERGLYVDIDSFPAPVCRTADEVVKAIKEDDRVSSESEEYKKELQEFYQKYMGSCDGKAVARILEAAEKLTND